MKLGKICLALLCCVTFPVHAADLLEVYRQALCSDPIFQQAIAQRLATKDGVPISLSNILPSLGLVFNPYIKRSSFSGSSYLTDVAGSPIAPRNNTMRAYAMTLSLSQTVFNYAQFANLANAMSLSKSADAVLNSALQELMIRVSKAYFTVLEDEDKLRYNEAAKLAFAQQLDYAQQQYDVGLKTVTDVYTARARYDSAYANYVAAETNLANDRENLRVITGKYYGSLSKLSERFPLITPKPANAEAWVKTAIQQNWAIKASQYNVQAARQTIHQQFGGHLPTVTLQGTVDRLYSDNINNYDSVYQRNGPGTENDKSIGLNFTFPIFSGGGVVAQTNQATHNFNVSQQQFEQTIRNTINNTRQSYLNILSGISQITADRQAVKSNISSLEGMEASYKVGTETLVTVLNQQERLFLSQTEYAKDRYAYVNNLLLLKQAAGTLSFDDLQAINRWLTIDEEIEQYHYRPVKIAHPVVKPQAVKKRSVTESKKHIAHLKTKHRKHVVALRHRTSGKSV